MNRRVKIAGAALAVAVVAVVVWRQAGSPGLGPPVEIPTIVDAGMEPQVVAKLRQLRGGVVAAPRSAEAWSRYAQALHAHDALAEAIASYRAASELDGDDFRWPYLAGLAQGKLDAASARPWFERAAELEPQHAAFYVNYGDLLLQLGDLSAAATSYRSALAVDPASVYGHYGLAQVALLEGDTDEAVRRLQIALRLAPHHGESHTLLAQAYHRMGEAALAEREEALARSFPGATRADDDVVRAMESQAVDAQSYARRGASLAGQGEFAAAEREFRVVLRLRDGNAQDWANLGGSLTGQGRYPEAVAAYERSVELEPDNVETLNNFAVTLLRTGETRRSGALLDQAMAVEPGNADTHYHRGLVDAHERRLDDAVAAYRRAIELNPSHGGALTSYGLASMQQGRPDAARAAWQKAVDANPYNASARYNLAVLTASEGGHAEAIGLLDEGIRLNPGALDMTTMLAWELATAPQERLRDGVRAVQLAEQTFRARPDDPRQAEVLGAALAEAGQFQRAVSVSERALQRAAGDARSPATARIERRLADYRSGIPFHQPATGPGSGITSAPD